MNYSIQVKNKKNKNVTLKIKDNQLEIDNQSYTLDSIYAIKHLDNKLHLNLIQQESVVTESTEQKSLTNIRPKELRWVRHLFEWETENDANEFVSQLNLLVLPHRAKFEYTFVFCILNPTSGGQQAEKQWEKIVKPMLVTAGFQEKNLSVVLTQKDGQTRKIAKDLGEKILQNQYDVPPIILSMGGDGTLHEVVNGLSDTTGKAGSFRLAALPAGSGNAFTLGLGIESVEQAVLKVIHAKEEKPFYFMDVKLGHSTDREDWYEHIQYDASKEPTRLLVVFSWGFHAQIVSKSRYLRYLMGNIRFSIVAKFLLTFLSHYQGELVLKNPQKYNPTTSSFESQPNPLILKDKKFTYFVASKQHSLERGFKIAPFASTLTDDLDIVLLREGTSESLMDASMKAFQNGAHVQSHELEYFKANELYLRVKEKAELCLDGEIHDLSPNGVAHLKVIESSSDQISFTIFV